MAAQVQKLNSKPTDEMALLAGEMARSPEATLDTEQLIQKIAYQKAELRGFQPGQELDDWLAAELEVKTALGQI